MKKFVALILALICLFLSSCSDGDKDYETPQTSNASDTTHTEDTEQDDILDYESIERFHASGYETLYFGNKDDDVVLSVPCPKDWSFVSADGHTDIKRGGNTVGRILSGRARDLEQWSELKTEKYSFYRGSATMIIESNGSNVRYRYVFVHSANKVRTTTLLAKCSEIDKLSEYKLLKSITSVKKKQGNTIGSLSNLENAREILILGNSFIASSNIGGILNEMLSLNGKSCSVNAISRGYATVYTYINDDHIMSDIKSGKYDAVFICGFYDDQQVTNLGTLKTACDISKTQLVIFPAHNENAMSVDLAKLKYPSLLSLNWKSELDELIYDDGVDRWDLCTDDQHDHSKPLAGYVGAHMIYRAMYSELPKEAMQNTISQDYIDRILGDYAYRSDITTIDENKIIYVA